MSKLLSGPQFTYEVTWHHQPGYKDTRASFNTIDKVWDVIDQTRQTCSNATFEVVVFQDFPLNGGLDHIATPAIIKPVILGNIWRYLIHRHLIKVTPHRGDMPLYENFERSNGVAIIQPPDMRYGTMQRSFVNFDGNEQQLEQIPGFLELVEYTQFVMEFLDGRYYHKVEPIEEFPTRKNPELYPQEKPPP